MAQPFYQYFAFIQPDSDADLEKLKANLQSFYSKLKEQPTVALTGKELTLSFGDYNFSIYLADEDYVLAEAIEIADDRDNNWNENPFDKKMLKTCSKRLEISGDEDYNMDYFNDSLFIVETIEEFKGVVIFNIG